MQTQRLSLSGCQEPQCTSPELKHLLGTGSIKGPHAPLVQFNRPRTPRSRILHIHTKPSEHAARACDVQQVVGCEQLDGDAREAVEKGARQTAPPAAFLHRVLRAEQPEAGRRVKHLPQLRDEHLAQTEDREVVSDPSDIDLSRTIEQYVIGAALNTCSSSGMNTRQA